MRCDLEFLADSELYRRVLLDQVPRARKFLWLATSDLKDLYIDQGKKRVPFLKLISQLIDDNVSIRLIHAKEPGPNFRRDFDRYTNLIEGMEKLLCPRIHFKAVVVDGKFAYTGSANLTGAGMGAKSEGRRNFESGVVTTDPTLVGAVMKQFDQLWMGNHCPGCRRKKHCFEYREME
jgi:phosphatidylserine/phosphatidylglycerophosphate/cardiolipin synthase-like enzyme